MHLLSLRFGQFVSQRIIHVFSKLGRFVKDGVGFSKPCKDSRRSATPDLIIVQMEMKRLDFGVNTQKSLQGNRNHILSFCFENTGKGQQMLPSPIPTCSILHCGVAEQINGSLKEV